jgi:hypothetical protein
MHGVTLALLAGAAALIGGAVFVALRAPGRLESETNAGKMAFPLLPLLERRERPRPRR